MTELTWDNVGERTFEGGVDRGVLYLLDGTAVAWSGITSVTERPNRESEVVYYDGAKVYELWSLGDYEGTIKAITYPDEVSILEGLEIINDGVYVADQLPRQFSMSYRTGVGSDLEGEAAHHKIHILFNLMLNPSDKVYESLSGDPALTEFEWEVSSIPSEVPGFRPSSHIIVDTSKLPYWLVDNLMTILYGDEFTDPGFLTPEEFIEFLTSAALWTITDLGDGSFTAETVDDELFTDLGDREFELEDVTITVLDEDSYLITSA